MNIRRLRNKLPGVIVRREGKQVNFRQQQPGKGEAPLSYTVSGKQDEASTEAMIRSKMPFATLPHSR